MIQLAFQTSPNLRAFGTGFLVKSNKHLSVLVVASVYHLIVISPTPQLLFKM